MGYYGITFSSNNLSGNFYVNYELSMLVKAFMFFFFPWLIFFPWNIFLENGEG